VARPVAEGAGWRAGLGDRVGPTARGTEGPGVALLAVGPRAVAVGARGGRAAADEARLGCRLVAAAGTDARAAVERIAGADAPTVGRAPRCRVALEAAGAGRVDVTAEAAEYVQLTADGLSRLGRRPARQGEGDREAADVVDRRRRAVMGGREALAQRRVGRRAGHAVVGAAVAPGRARAGARRGARAVRIGVAWPVEVRARAAGLVAHRADLDARRIREQVAVEEDLRVERQAEARGAAGAVGRATRVGRHRVDDADARRRAGRIRDRERRAEQAPDARTVPVAAGLGRGEVGEGEARPAAGGHPGERIAHVGHGVRQRHAVLTAAGVEAAAGELLGHGARAVLHRAAVAGPYAGGEAQLARLRGEAAAGREGRGGHARRRRGGARQSRGRDGHAPTERRRRVGYALLTRRAGPQARPESAAAGNCGRSLGRGRGRGDGHAEKRHDDENRLTRSAHDFLPFRAPGGRRLPSRGGDG